MGIKNPTPAKAALQSRHPLIRRGEQRLRDADYIKKVEESKVRAADRAARHSLTPDRVQAAKTRAAARTAEKAAPKTATKAATKTATKAATKTATKAATKTAAKAALGRMSPVLGAGLIGYDIGSVVNKIPAVRQGIADTIDRVTGVEAKARKALADTPVRKRTGGAIKSSGKSPKKFGK